MYTYDIFYVCFKNRYSGMTESKINAEKDKGQRQVHLPLSFCIWCIFVYYYL